MLTSLRWTFPSKSSSSSSSFALTPRWNPTTGSSPPLLVPPGRPSRGVRPIEVSRDLPCWMAHMDAPEPRWKIIKLREVGEVLRWLENVERM